MRISSILAALCIAGFAAPASAATFGVTGDGFIATPDSVLDAADTNTQQQGFLEQTRVTLVSPLAVDGGLIAAGTVVDSYMIFLNGVDDTLIETVATWTFPRMILGTMSDEGGTLEAASTNFLGNPGVTYPGSAFDNRGLEMNGGVNDDMISFLGSTLTLEMNVTQPGDWVRVVTAPVPLPAAGWMLIGGLAGLGFLGRKRRAA